MPPAHANNTAATVTSNANNGNGNDNDNGHGHGHGHGHDHDHGDQNDNKWPLFGSPIPEPTPISDMLELTTDNNNVDRSMRAMGASIAAMPAGAPSPFTTLAAHNKNMRDNGNHPKVNQIGTKVHGQDLSLSRSESVTARELLKGFDPVKIIEEELNHLSVEERGKVYEDVHGPCSAREETPVFLAAKLDDMSIEVAMIKHKPAYILARTKDQPYADDPNLWLKFLRFDEYNPRIAAKKLIDWFELKLDLFGSHLLVETITLDDLCAEAYKIQTDGRCQILPARDAHGRAVICCLEFDLSMLVSEASRRNYFYFCMKLLEDEDVQRNGVVCIRNGREEADDLSMAAWRGLYKCAKLTETIPLCLRGFHFIAENSTVVQHISSFIQLSFTKHVRHRCRTHRGTFMECRYSLLQYGIPVDHFPINNDGEMKLENHAMWLQHARREEAVILAERRRKWQSKLQIVPHPSSLAHVDPKARATSPNTILTTSTVTTCDSNSLDDSITSMASSRSRQSSSKSNVPVLGVAEDMCEPLIVRGAPATSLADPAAISLASPLSHASDSPRVDVSVGNSDDNGDGNGDGNGDSNGDSNGDANMSYVATIACNGARLGVGGGSSEQAKDDSTRDGSAVIVGNTKTIKAVSVPTSACPPRGIKTSSKSIQVADTDTANDGVYLPSPHDVILGRGRPFQDHAGNQNLRKLIAEWFDSYNASPRKVKMAIAERIVDIVRESNGRFLKRSRCIDGATWTEVSLVEAREKVSHGFRKKREMDAAAKRRASKQRVQVEARSVGATAAGGKSLKAEPQGCFGGPRCV